MCVCSYVGLWRERARKSGYVLEQLLDQEFTFKRIAILLRQATTAVDLKKVFSNLTDLILLHSSWKARNNIQKWSGNSYLNVGYFRNYITLLYGVVEQLSYDCTILQVASRRKPHEVDIPLIVSKLVSTKPGWFERNSSSLSATSTSVSATFLWTSSSSQTQNWARAAASLHHIIMENALKYFSKPAMPHYYNLWTRIVSEYSYDNVLSSVYEWQKGEGRGHQIVHKLDYFILAID